MVVTSTARGALGCGVKENGLEVATTAIYGFSSFCVVRGARKGVTHDKGKNIMKRICKFPARLYMRVRLSGADEEQWASAPITRHLRSIGGNRVRINRTTYEVSLGQRWAILSWDNKGERRETYRMPLIDWFILRGLAPASEVKS